MKKWLVLVMAVCMVAGVLFVIPSQVGAAEELVEDMVILEQDFSDFADGEQVTEQNLPQFTAVNGATLEVVKSVYKDGSDASAAFGNSLKIPTIAGDTEAMGKTQVEMSNRVIQYRAGFRYYVSMTMLLKDVDCFRVIVWDGLGGALGVIMGDDGSFTNMSVNEGVPNLRLDRRFDGRNISGGKEDYLDFMFSFEVAEGQDPYISISLRERKESGAPAQGIGYALLSEMKIVKTSASYLENFDGYSDLNHYQQYNGMCTLTPAVPVNFYNNGNWHGIGQSGNSLGFSAANTTTEEQLLATFNTDAKENIFFPEKENHVTMDLALFNLAYVRIAVLNGEEELCSVRMNNDGSIETKGDVQAEKTDGELLYGSTSASNRLKFVFTAPAEKVTMAVYSVAGEGETVLVADNFSVRKPQPAAEKHTITVQCNKGGTATSDLSEAYEGDTVTITVLPGENSTLKQIYVNGVASEASFRMPDEDVIVEVVFDTKYKVTVAEDLNGGTISLTETVFSAGDTVSLTITPMEGWKFVSASYTDESGSSVAVSGYNFVMPESNITVIAIFEKEEFTVTLNQISGVKYELTADSSETTPYGEMFAFKVIAEEGYDISQIKVKAGDVVLTADAEGVYSLKIKENTVITVTGVTKKPTEETGPEKGGCGSSLSGNIMVASVPVLIMSIAVLVLRKKRKI